MGRNASKRRPALGLFKHEAVAVDPIHGQLYLTEGESDGRLYRFTPSYLSGDGHPLLDVGSLEVAVVGEPLLPGVDNVMVSPDGQVLVAEDGGD